jgi:hypothetical protein
MSFLRDDWEEPNRDRSLLSYVMLNLFQHLIQLITYAGETLNQVQGDEKVNGINYETKRIIPHFFKSGRA